MSFELKRLEVCNFKKHASLDVEFSESLTVIRGPNWAGKSSVLQAVLFALFGTHAVPGKKGGLVRRGQTGMFVKLLLNLGDREVLIKRTPSSAGVFFGDSETPDVSGTSSVDEWVLAQLGVSRDIALQLCVSPQTQTAALLSLGAAAVNRLVERLSGADQVERMIERAEHRIRGLEQESQGELPDLGDLRGKLEAAELELAEATEASRQAEQRQQEAARFEADAAAKLEAARAAQSAIEKASYAKKRHDDLAARMEAAQHRAANLRKAISVTRPSPAGLEARSREIRQILADQVALLREQSGLRKWFATTGADWEQAEAEVIPAHAKLAAEAEAAKEALGQSEAAGLEVSRLFAAKQAEIRAAQKALKDSYCPECKRPFEGHHREDWQAKLASLEHEAAALQREHAIKKSEWTEAKLAQDSRLQRLKALAARLPPSDYEEVYNGKAARLQELLGLVMDTQPLEQELEGIDAELMAHRQHVAHVESDRQTLNELAAEMQRMEASMQQAAAEMAGWDAPAPDLKGLTQQLALRRDVLAQAGQEVANAAGKLAGWKTATEFARIAFQKAEKDHAARKLVEARLERWEAFRRWLRSNKSRLLNDLWSGILGFASDFLTQATEGYATELQRTHDGEFWIVEDGEASPANGGISGGMAAIAGTALKLALIELLPTAPRFLLLDEPSSELNDERAANLAAALATGDRQLVMVTHRVGEEYLADQVVEL